MAHAGKATGKGGLALLFEMVLGGLVGTSPHMISASVMALARLLHQFANELGGVLWRFWALSMGFGIITAFKARMCIR